MTSKLKVIQNADRTPSGDELYTPPVAIEPLLRFLDKSKTYIEPTSFKSKNIINCLMMNGYQIESTGDKDFLEDEIDAKDGIITNPPFSKKDQFLKKAYEIGKPFAFLLPLTSLEGCRVRQPLFNKYGIQLLVLNKRVDFIGKKKPYFPCAWFCSKMWQGDSIQFDIGHE